MVFLTKLKPEPMGAHNLSTAYGVNSLVMSGDGAAAYISVKDVPAGTPLSDTDYWQPHTNLSAVVQKANAARDEMLEISRNLTDIVEKSGNPVQAELVGGLPFDRVATSLEPIQAGSGDPSPTNIRAISGWTGAELNHSNAAGVEHTYAADFGQTIYGGTLDWMTGVLTVDRAMVTLDGTESYGEFGTGYPNLFVLWAGKIQQKGVQLPHEQNICSHYKSHASRFDENNWYLGGDGLQAFFNDMRFTDVNDFVAYVAAQYAAGTPVQIAYKLATPTTIQLTPREIKQLQGVNTLYGDGSISIVGRVDPVLALDAVRYTPQTLTSDQQDAARDNIGAASAESVTQINDNVNLIRPDDSAVDGKPWTSRKIVEALCPPFEVSGSAVTCHPVEGFPLVVVSRIDAVQQGSGDPSPENVRPISGWNAVNTVRCCKNLNKINGSILTADAKELTLIDFGKDVYFDNLTFSCFMENAVCQSMSSVFICYKSDGKFTTISASSFGVSGVNTAQNGRKTYTLNGLTVRKINSLFMPNGYGKWSGVIKDCQIEVGSTATAYGPYRGDTYTAALPETVYGGELDWSTGVLTIMQKRYALPISAMNNNEEYPGWKNVEWVLDLVNEGVDGILELNACNISTIVRVSTRGGRKTIYFIKSDLGGLTQTEIKETYPDLMLEFVAYLLTPYTIQLTPQQIAALSGVNTLYTDSGDTSVYGRTDPVWLTQSLMDRIAALESAATNI